MTDTTQTSRRDRHAQLAADVRAGLTATPRTLPSKYLYDARGSQLFDEITRLPEYYPTRAETAILERYAEDIAAATGAETLVELGSGTSEKTRLLLDALEAAGTLRRLIPVDVDPTILRQAQADLAERYPDLAVEPVVADFEQDLAQLPAPPHRLVVFLGSTIGNLDPQARRRFFAAVAAVLGEGDAFLLGTDLVKDTNRLVAAYDDAAGVTAEFDRNVLRVLNRELDADFDVEAFEHRAVWVPEAERIEMRLRARGSQRVRVADLDLSLADGEEITTEQCHKFRREGVAAELAECGLVLDRWWTDPAGDVALSLVRPAPRT